MDVSSLQTMIAGLDPFLHFSVEIVSMINDHLQPRETEILRRVCKNWKRLSELCNDRRAIVKHCPAVEQDLKRNLASDTLDQATANFYFRRWLCHEQSIKAGLASNAAKFYRVTHWDIRGNRLIAGGREDTLEIYSLALGSMGKLVNQLALKDLMRPFNPSRFWLAGLYAINGGGFIVQLDAEASPFLIKLTDAGEVVWCIRNRWSGVTVGKNSVYVFHYMPWRPNIADLETLDLEDASQQKISAVAAPSCMTRAYGPFQLVLCSSEAFVAVKCKNEMLCILDTLRGALVTVNMPGLGRLLSSDFSSLRPEANATDFLETWSQDHRVRFVFRYHYDGESHSFQRRTILNPSAGRAHGDAPCGGIDIYRRVLFSERRLGKLSSFVIEPLESLVTDGHGPNSANPLTIPLGHKGRESVKFAIQKTIPDDWMDPDTFEIYHGYMVFHDVATRRLLIASFEPPW